MRHLPLIAAGALALIGSSAAAQSPREDSFEQIEKGRYLATVGDCAACHTVPGGRPFAGGVVLKTPFGSLVGANITPDPETGIGNMTEEEFQKVMSDGQGKGGYHLYGAMPFTAYTKVTKTDNAAIYAYLQTLEPVKNQVETNQLPFPFNVRASLSVWNALNFEKGEFKASLEKSVDWNRGAYIVEGLGHCGTCHTPKNFLGGDENSDFLTGATLQDWYAPNITADPHKGIGAWTDEDIITYLKTGTNRFDTASGPMAEEVENSSRHWTDADLKAVATYLKESAGADAKSPAALAATDARMVAGREIYADRCSACHTPNGEGVPKLFPQLAKAPLVNGDDATSLMRVVLAGSRAGATDAAPTGPAMPSFAWNLSDDDVANVLTYIRNSWGNAAKPVEASDVGQLRERLTSGSR
ncbi:cytochrome c [Rhizobium sp. P28RR-XV]|uniref:cytochrome c n=1 Tax=Rhizobium sp. P28RR-XV TaxID=2726737 RepID=UPI001456BCFF|nr:cytochrome c [Rhizobium sp. P28RR-XV]NLR88375.1 cytochrome c [Rhizobium sp. P28RR-XV]